jgi:hypothetical protein
MASIVGRVYSECYTATMTPGAISFDELQSMYNKEMRIRREALTGHANSSKAVLKLPEKKELTSKVLRHPDAPANVCPACLQNNHVSSEQCDWKPVAG